MAKDKLTDYDSTASGNLDVGGISVAEGMLPSGVNNAIRELMSHQADAFGAGTPLYVDQTNNRLGINQAAPAHPLHVGTDDLIVDASGNLLVGTTDTTPSANDDAGGISLRETGQLNVSRDGAAALDLNRKTSDGDIAVFRRSGSTVGSIGTYNGDGYIGNGDVGFIFADGDDSILPVNTSTPEYRNDAVSLGNASARWKNLHLSGGVYLGGTGSANYLDDYEEGTFTSTVGYDTSVTDTSPDQSLNVTGRYIKVGKICIVTWPAFNASTFGTGVIFASASLPFTSGSSNEAIGAIYPYNVRGRYGSTTNDNANFAMRAYSGSNLCGISSAYPTFGGGFIELYQSSSYFTASIVYETT